jgi:MFS family permease
MASRSSIATLSFSCLGHLYVHLCTAFYFIIVLALESDWQTPYHELIGLWTLGSLLVGLAALPAGLLSDRVGAPAMMIVFFIGLGACSVGAGTSTSTGQLILWLAGIGLFAAIYHPVGVPWLVRNVGLGKGKALGFNGIFGSMGTAVAGLAAGALIDIVNWRAAFIVPGLISVATGFALLVFVKRGQVTDSVSMESDNQDSRGTVIRVFGILAVTMFLMGIVFATTQTALPKVFAERVDAWTGDGTFGIGVLVALVYGAAGIMQVLGGHLADRFPLKPLYLSILVCQVPLLLLAASVGGGPLVAVATLMVVVNVGALPAENLILVRYAPSGRHGLVFGLKFVLAFGATPLAVQIVALITGRTGGFYWVFALLAIFALTASTVALFLPGRIEQRQRQSGTQSSPATAK